MSFLLNAEDRQCGGEQRGNQNGGPPVGGRSTVVATHFVAAIRSEILFEIVLDKFPRAQAHVASRIIVHAFVQVEHNFILFAALVTPVTIQRPCHFNYTRTVYGN